MAKYRVLTWVLLLLPASFVSFSQRASAQSTFGSIVGTVKDQSGSVLPNATVVLENQGTAATRTVATDDAGSYELLNLDAGTYQLTVQAAGFNNAVFANLVLLARDTRRIDAALTVRSATETTTVYAQTTGGVITTDESNLASTKTGRELVDLPVAVYSLSTGSTSPLSTLTTEPGVQVDDSGTLAVAGATPQLMSYTIDGISSLNVEFSGPIAELFPSFNSISEIRVGATNNNAEYSGVADVTTTSRAGSNNYHGGIFENLQNTALTAGNPFTGKPKIIMNNFGGFAGGPLSIPRLYNGHDKTFFFVSYEGLRLPREAPLVESVPSLDMRNGNLWNYLTAKGAAAGLPGPLAIHNYDGMLIPCTGPSNCSVPVSPVAANAMKYLMPLPNTGNADSFQNNYAVNFPAPISSDQFDVRIDQNLTAKQSIYGRYTFKNRSVTSAPTVASCVGLCATSPTAASPLLGGILEPEEDRGFTLAHNYTIEPDLINEFRAGFNLTRSEINMNVNSASLLSQVGITGISSLPPTASIPNFQIAGFTNTGGLASTHRRSKIIQLLDNLTWVRGKHTFKFGGDVLRVTDHDEGVFDNYQLGQYTFNSSSQVGATIGDPFTQFLLGYPDSTNLAQVTNPAMNGLAYAYAGFAQDDWKITPYLTINAGFRYELHPPLRDAYDNTANFLPDYNENGVHGAVVVPNARGLSNSNPGFVVSISPTPILTAGQAGIPDTLRYTDKGDYEPRIGFAYRLAHNDRTVIRGGWGRFIEMPLGLALVGGWGVNASFLPTYAQSYGPNGRPVLSFPSPFPSNLYPPGIANFAAAFAIHYKDPSVQQWNLTFEHDLGHDIGMRISYTGSHGTNLVVINDLNQVHANSLGYTNAAVQGTIPYPLWGILETYLNQAVSNYNSLTAVLEKRMSHGLQFQTSYVFTRDLSNAGGAVPTSFVAQYANFVSDRFRPGLDYGNVIFDRRHRFLSTFLYTLPFGKGGTYLANSGRLLDSVIGGWQLGGVLIFQSGPFLTPYETSTDPAATNVLNVQGIARADVVPGISPYAIKGLTSQAGPVFLNPAAFAVPANNIGRFGDAGVGSVVGPGTASVALSLIKSMKLTERLQLQFGAQAANVFNHRNYDVPNMAVDQPSFGTISALQTQEGAGPRNVQITARINF